MADKDNVVELFAEYKTQREALLTQLKELDTWYDEQYYLLVTSQNSPL